MDLVSKVKLFQPLYLRYNQLLQMVSSSAFQEFHYAFSEGILHFMIQVWVPEGTIRVGYQGKNKMVGIIKCQFNWKGITTYAACHEYHFDSNIKHKPNPRIKLWSQEI
ncbi:hypothetical protein DSO57_1028688 [Entomophthora muscae]|uniref:Uncharacterized protein n=1 Tax=Entomophthora muscae TaxID=34485 RepID=A0ACC2SEA5_9FUNG|nr:hypothetical protein DSO57_1028688 [Entomophthora muscae]